MAAANAALDEKVADLGGQPFDSTPMDSALLGIKERAAAAVEAASLSPEEKQAKAIAAELAPLVAPPSPETADDYEDESDEAKDDEAEYYVDEADQIWQHEDGHWSRVDEDALDEEPPEDQWPTYLSPTANSQFADTTDDEEDLDDAA